MKTWLRVMSSALTEIQADSGHSKLCSMYVYMDRQADTNGSRPFTNLGVLSVSLSLWTDYEGISAVPSTSSCCLSLGKQ